MRGSILHLKRQKRHLKGNIFPINVEDLYWYRQIRIGTESAWFHWVPNLGLKFSSACCHDRTRVGLMGSSNPICGRYQYEFLTSRIFTVGGSLCCTVSSVWGQGRSLGLKSKSEVGIDARGALLGGVLGDIEVRVTAHYCKNLWLKIYRNRKIASSVLGSCKSRYSCGVMEHRVCQTMV